MEPSFDPYHKWLGIPPDEQPPNHYRLLGIRPLEADPEVIQSAADQRMAHLRTYQTSRYADWSQRLLNEVAAAKICLLTPAKKAAYDQKWSDLPAQSVSENLSPLPPAGEQQGRAWRAAPQRIELSLPDGLPPGSLPEAEQIGGGDLETRSKKRLPLGAVIGALTAMAAVALAGLTYWSIESREASTAAAKPPSPSPSRPLKKGTGSELNSEKTAKDDGREVPVPLLQQAANLDRTRNGELRTGPTQQKKSPAGKPVPESWPSDRVILPSAAVQEEAMNLAHDLYQDELAKAKTVPEKEALARTLLAEAKAAKSADVSTLVLLRLAQDTAVQASDVATAFAAIDAMTARYRIDPWEMKWTTLSACAKTARTPAQHLALAKQAERLRDELAATGAVAQAADMARLAATEREAAGPAKP
jgi:hypothetical protein